MICNAIGCQKAATKKPIVTFTAIVQPKGPRSRMNIPLGLCDDHANPDPSRYVGDDGWKMICTNMKAAGYAEPDRKSLQVEFEPVH